MADNFCSKCGTSVPAGAGLCPKCGASVIPDTTDTNTGTVGYTDPIPAYASPVYDVPPPKSSRYSVLGVGGFIGNLLLFSIPVIGWIICIVWACGGCKNENRKNHARAVLLLTVIVLVIFAVAGILLYSVLSEYLTGLAGLSYFLS